MPYDQSFTTHSNIPYLSSQTIVTNNTDDEADTSCDERSVNTNNIITENNTLNTCRKDSNYSKETALTIEEFDFTDDEFAAFCNSLDEFL